MASLKFFRLGVLNIHPGLYVALLNRTSKVKPGQHKEPGSPTRKRHTDSLIFVVTYFNLIPSRPVPSFGSYCRHKAKWHKHLDHPIYCTVNTKPTATLSHSQYVRFLVCFGTVTSHKHDRIDTTSPSRSIVAFTHINPIKACRCGASVTVSGAHQESCAADLHRRIGRLGREVEVVTTRW